jgi:hypothetical protein
MTTLDLAPASCSCYFCGTVSRRGRRRNVFDARSGSGPDLLRRIFDVEPLRRPQCAAAMRIVAFITARAMIDRIRDYLRGPRASSRGFAPRAACNWGATATSWRACGSRDWVPLSPRRLLEPCDFPDSR